MPDNSAKIAKIERILENGVRTVVIDGQTITYDFDELRLQLRRLKEEDTSGTSKRRSTLGFFDLSRSM